MTKQDIVSLLGGQPRVLSEHTIVFEGKNGTAPMTPLEKRMWGVICSLTKS